MSNEIAPQEAFGTHELISFKNVCLTKSVTMSPLISDQGLKAILEENINTEKRQITELKGLIEKAAACAASK
ncbi:spore coat protein [Clostridium sp. 19966]|uniref:spore coat protein n=1 Tax=Clostridium sp. 19966 TaxID=2768166 RepID=UPI0028DF185F|nr:spore coat protein [Clostridium sp. 19966]MDT8716893.1 spore coat protein [Clostridium sp. 19966]